MQKRVRQRVILKSLLWGIYCLGMSFPSFADTQETVDMAAVERAIEASKGYQGKVSCGKIDMGNKRYTFRIPEIYQWNFGIEYFGDSPWTKGGIAKKEDPCVYDIKNAMLSFFWPSMKPYNGKYVNVSTDLKDHPNIVTASLSRNSMQTSTLTASQVADYIILVKTNVLGYPGETKSNLNTIENAKVLAMGEYLPDLGLYHYTFDKYINPTPYEVTQGRTKKDHNKREIFWSLDKDKHVIDLIVCKYLALDITQMTIKDTVCKLNTTIYQYDVSNLLIRYGGEHMRDWKNIRSAAIQQYKAFITEAVLP